MSRKTVFCDRRSRKSAYDDVAGSSPSAVKTSTSVSGAATGSGLSSSASTSENIAEFTPTPRPSDSTATAKNPGLRRIARHAYATSFRTASTMTPPRSRRPDASLLPHTTERRCRFDRGDQTLRYAPELRRTAASTTTEGRCFAAVAMARLTRPVTLTARPAITAS